jgi:hypothetical protein
MSYNGIILFNDIIKTDDTVYATFNSDTHERGRSSTYINDAPCVGCDFKNGCKTECNDFINYVEIGKW